MLDTEPVYTQVTSTILARYGLEFEWSVKAQMMGQREDEVIEIDKAAKILIKSTNIPMTPAEYLFERNEAQKQLFPHVKAMPGIVKLATHLKSHNIPIVVATSSHREAMMLKTQNHQQLFSLFDGNILCGDDPVVKHGKPAPDIFIEGAKLIGNPPSGSCLVFEDAGSGVLAALNAKMNVIWVPDPNNKSHSELREKCAEVLGSLEEFVPEKYGLPPYATD